MVLLGTIPDKRVVRGVRALAAGAQRGEDPRGQGAATEVFAVARRPTGMYAWSGCRSAGNGGGWGSS